MLALAVVQEIMTRFSSHLIVGATSATGTYVHSCETVSDWLWSMMAYAYTVTVDSISNGDSYSWNCPDAPIL